MMLLTAIIIMSCRVVNAQDKRIVDSLETVIGRLSLQKQQAKKPEASFKIDTSIVQLYGELIRLYSNVDNDKMLWYGRKALQLSQAIDYEKGIAIGYNTIGYYYIQSDSVETGKPYCRKALEIRKKIKDYPGICRSLTNLAFAEGYTDQGLAYHKESLQIALAHQLMDAAAAAYHNIGLHYEIAQQPVVAIDYYLKAKQINERPGGNQLYLSRNLMQIGNVYEALLKHQMAVEYYQQALQIARKNHDVKLGISIMMMQAGSYTGMKQYEQSISLYQDVIKQAQELHDESMVYQAYLNLGDAYYTIGKYADALKYDTMAYHHFEHKDAYMMSVAAANTGMVYHKLKAYQKGLSFAMKALAVVDSNNLDLLKWIHLNLADLYSGIGNHKVALDQYKLYKKYYDSLYNNENKEKILQLQMQSDFDKKESALKAKQEKKDLQQRNIRNSIAAGLVLLSFFFVVVYRQRNKVKREKERSDELLLNILPSEVAEELKTKGSAATKMIDKVTVLFTDIKDFTHLSEKLSPVALVEEINECFSAFDHIMQKHGVEKIKTIGDSYMAAGGIPTPNQTHPIDVVRAAFDIQQFMLDQKLRRQAEGKVFFEIRIGIHTGSVVAGIVGVKKFAYDIWGDTVNIASRMESSGEAGKVNISSSTYELVKDHFHCAYRGKIDAKGKGQIDMYFVENSK
ncbi:MAG: tetratricopeptide repeat protein [Bacteroidetes bacterium]|nr:tetratricopeptide repeat protein [Bacteroidota bacterium]